MKKTSIIFSSIFCLLSLGNSFAYTSSDILNAQFLANQGIIVKQSSAAGYRLDDTITRAEAIGIALKIKGITLPDNYTCKNYFIDAPYNPSNSWICRAVELAADDGIISRANTKARPQDSITRSEIMGIVSDIAGFRATSSDIGMFTFSDKNYQDWQKKVFHRFFSEQIIPQDVIIQYHQYPNSPEKYISSIEYYPNKNATRGYMFDLIKKSYKFHDGVYFFPKFYPIDNETVQSMLRDTGVTIGNNKVTSTTEINKQSFYFGDWKYRLTEYQQHFEVDNYGPLLDSIDGIVTVNGTKFIKGYISGICSNTTYVTYTKNSIISFQYSCDDGDFAKDIQHLDLKTDGWYFGAKELLRLYYGNLANQNFYGAYSMRFPVGVSEETFISWYKNVVSVLFREDTLKNLGDNTYEFLVDMTENGVKSTYKVKSKVDLENFKINNISSVKQ